MTRLPVIIEVALNGVTTRRRNPLVPVTPDELVAEAVGCVDAGATVVHTHVVDPTAPADRLPRASIEVRALTIW